MSEAVLCPFRQRTKFGLHLLPEQMHHALAPSFGQASCLRLVFQVTDDVAEEFVLLDINISIIVAQTEATKRLPEGKEKAKITK